MAGRPNGTSGAAQGSSTGRLVCDSTRITFCLKRKRLVQEHWVYLVRQSSGSHIWSVVIRSSAARLPEMPDFCFGRRRIDKSDHPALGRHAAIPASYTTCISPTHAQTRVPRPSEPCTSGAMPAYGEIRHWQEPCRFSVVLSTKFAPS